MVRDWVRFFIFLFFGDGGGFGFVFSFFPSPLSGLLVVGVATQGSAFHPWATILRRFAEAPTLCLSLFAYMGYPLAWTTRYMLWSDLELPPTSRRYGTGSKIVLRSEAGGRQSTRP